MAAAAAEKLAKKYKGMSVIGEAEVMPIPEEVTPATPGASMALCHPFSSVRLNSVLFRSWGICLGNGTLFGLRECLWVMENLFGSILSPLIR